MIEEFLRYLGLERNRSALTIEAYRRDLEQCARFLRESGTEPPVDLASASLRHLRAWIAALATEGDAPRTLRRKTQALRSMYRWMQKRGIRTDNPAADITLAKTNRPLPTIARPDQLETLISDGVPGPDPTRSIRDTLIIELLYSCGLRQAELLNLTNADVDTRTGRMRVVGKGDKTRIIPLPPALCDTIDRWRQVRDDATTVDGSRAHAPLIPGRGGAQLSKSRLYTIVRDALAFTSASRRSPHTLRHTFATAMVNGGADINSVKHLMGHASLATTQIYTHLDLSTIQRDYHHAHPRGGIKSQHHTDDKGNNE